MVILIIMFVHVWSLTVIFVSYLAISGHFLVNRVILVYQGHFWSSRFIFGLFKGNSRLGPLFSWLCMVIFR